MDETKFEVGIDPSTGKTVRAVFFDIDPPPKKEPKPPIKETVPKCWVVQHLVYIRYVKYDRYQPNFGTSPIEWGSLPDCRARARELGDRLNLPIVEVGEINPDLESETFRAPAIYIVTERFDQFNDPGHRVFRY
jgi:hypothetical protein